MELGLRGKVALVGGSSRGIGKAVALGLAQEGARVTLCARGEATLRQAADEIRRSTGAQLLPLVADMAKPEDIRRLVQETVAHFGGLDIVVNNAGGPPTGTVQSLTEEQWQGALAQNLLSAVRLSREAIPHLRRRGGGRIINILSIAVKQPIDGLVLSNAARLGVLGFAKTLSREVARDGILVNNVCPGAILTDRIRELARLRGERENRTEAEVLEEEARSLPLGRHGRPEEIGALIVFLASERASYITGCTFQVDGGSALAVF